MSDADEEEYVVYEALGRYYFQYTPRHNYEWWAKNNPKDREHYPIRARGLTKTQAQKMVDLTKEEQ